MTAFSLSITSNGKKAARRLVAQGKATEKGFRKAMFIEGEELRTDVLRDIPRKTGNLAGTVFHEQIETASGVEEILGATADYALFVEVPRPGTQFTTGKARAFSDNFERRSRNIKSRLARRTKQFSKIAGG